MANYFTDVDEDTKALIEECTEGMHDSVKAEHLVNCLSAKHRRSMIAKGIFTRELQAKHDFEENLHESSMPKKP